MRRLFFSSTLDVRTEDGNGGIIQSPQFSAMNSQYELPKNVAIIMLQEVHDNDNSEVFLCLANIFEVEENEILSKSARVDLQTLFSNQEVLLLLLLRVVTETLLMVTQ
ncbi:hypothetical protein CY35_13G120900 [Sphagnum magellanicum]|nr:hypothetical protein CY35_13G120900 [Sphagnum magellanicum]